MTTLSSFKDTHELSSLEERLRLSEERLRSLTSIAGDWYWETDIEHRFTKFSASAMDAMRQEITVNIGVAPWEIDQNPGNRDIWALHRAQIHRRETFRNFEYERLDKEGERLTLSVSGAPFFTADGSFAGYRGVGMDITLRKQTEATLRITETRFRAVFSALTEAVVLRDVNGFIIDCNASAEALFGRPLADIKGQRSPAPAGWVLLREDGSPVPDDERPTTRILQTGIPCTGYISGYRKPDASILWTLANVHPLFEGEGRKPIGYVTSLTDITQRALAEKEIVRLNVDLENRVARRTAQLELANKELEAFSYSVAHDLRSPLSTIDGYCSLLEKALPPEVAPRASGHVIRIRNGIRRMGELTDGLLSLAQVARTRLNLSTVDISAEASLVMEHLRESDPGRRVSATIEPGMRAQADSSLLKEVLDNLIANAWKFSSKRAQTEISVGSEIGSDGQVTYFVSDNGAGFDMAYVHRLFGNFERLHSLQEFPGSGIGLATVKRIITRHGGQIWARSEVGKGSTFYFTLGNGDPGVSADSASTSFGALESSPAPAEPREALSLADQQFSNAFEHAAIGMVLTGLDSRRLRVNRSFCKMLGFSEAEMLSGTTRDITHPDDIEDDTRQRKRALAGEIETYQREKRYIHKAGHIVWGSLTCSLVRDADRKPLHFISQIQDINERKASERTLRESEERFRALTELSSDWFWEQDENFRFVQVTGDASNTNKFAVQNVTGMTRWELNHQNMSQSLWAAHRAQLERHEAFRDFELILLDNTGQFRYESINGVPIFDESGRFTGYRGTGRDNTEIRRITDALRAAASQLREITDTVPALIAFVDANQCYRFHNRAYEEAFGLTGDQIDGKSMQEVMGEEFYERVRSRVIEVLSGYPVVYERSQKTARGDMRDYVVNYSPRYGEGDEEDQVIGFYSLATDVTELKRIDRMKSEFVSTVSHELRTPLTSIRGSLGLISGGIAGELPETAKTLVGIANSNCERLIRLINDILDIEKIESGKMTLDLQVLPLKPLMMQVLAANEGFGAAQDVQLKLHCPDDDLQVSVDSDRLTQVVTNLLSNAMKFSPRGGTVDVHVLRNDFGVRIEVRDHGPGIPEEFRKRIFQKFSQADSSDTRQKGGTGLGLNISRAIVERLGGSIGFSTEAGVGTTFFLELPQWQPKPSFFARAEGQEIRNAPRMLVCEDDPDIARLISMMLEKDGFEADIAYSGAQALQLLEASSYVAMTLDLRLSDEDGLGLIQKLRQQESTAKLPIIVVSAMAEEGQLQFSHSPLTVSDWLSKPIDEDRLIRSVQRAVATLKNRKPRILHVEDDLDAQDIAAAVAEELADFEFATTLEEARAWLREERFDLVLLDLNLGNDSGWDLVADIDALEPRPPVIVFSAADLASLEARQAAAILVKGRTSNNELLTTIQRVLHSR